jgi:phenylacetate-CoA ligase
MAPDWPSESWEQLHHALHRRLGHAHEGLNFRIERAGTGELPRFELKAKRLIDMRETPVAAVK